VDVGIGAEAPSARLETEEPEQPAVVVDDGEAAPVASLHRLENAGDTLCGMASSALQSRDRSSLRIVADVRHEICSFDDADLPVGIDEERSVYGRSAAGSDDERLWRGLLDLSLEPFDLRQRFAVQLVDGGEQLVIPCRLRQLAGDDPVERDFLSLQVELAEGVEKE
jgi:hypothetical protein